MATSTKGDHIKEGPHQRGTSPKRDLTKDGVPSKGVHASVRESMVFFLNIVCNFFCNGFSKLLILLFSFQFYR